MLRMWMNGLASTVSCAETRMLIGISLWFGGQMISRGDASTLSITGGVVALTSAVNVLVAVLPRVALEVQVMSCDWLSASVKPEAGVHCTGRVPSTRSVAETV